jgi:hypothetical protein
MLLSSEHFFFASVAGFDTLRTILQRHCRQVKLVLSVRPLRDWTYSVYMQLVKAHGLGSEYDEAWLEKCCAGFLEHFRNLDRFGVPAIVYRYENSGLLPLFLRLIGEDEALASRFPEARVNRSLTVTELAILRRVNALYKDEALSRRISGELLERDPHSASASFPAAAEEPFRRFAETYQPKLDELQGEVMRQVRPILLEKSHAGAEPEHVDPDAVLDMLEIALRHVRDLQENYAADMKVHNSLKNAIKDMEATDDFFDPVHYLLLNADVARAGKEPWSHYRNNGRRERRMTGLMRRPT